jgi:hypothetical protein
MTRLEQLAPGASVRGLVAGATVRVVQVEWLGDQAVKVTFEEPSGAVKNRLVWGGPGRLTATETCFASPPRLSASVPVKGGEPAAIATAAETKIWQRATSLGGSRA